MPKGICPQTSTPKAWCPHYHPDYCRAPSRDDDLCIHVKTLKKAEKAARSFLIFCKALKVEIPSELEGELKEVITLDKPETNRLS